MVISYQTFFPVVSKNIAFSKKLLNYKIFETSFPIEKFIYILVARRLPLQKRRGPQKRFSGVFSENYTFLEKIDE